MELATSIRRREELGRRFDVLDDVLFAEAFPVAASPVSGVEEVKELVDAGSSDARHRSLPAKRGISEVNELPQTALKRSKIPALASINQVAEALAGASSKKALVTREKLRAGMNDQKGLLNLVGSSTDALEKTKRLELLKTAGIDSSANNARSSFADKLNAASLRLELGLGGHTAADTLLFGAKVLSCPGFLSRKNISDVENNAVDGSTTWKHQNAYAKMMIAGCLNQSKRIVERFDDILFGHAPEKLIQGTHTAIRDLLCSEQCRRFLANNSEGVEPKDAESNDFIKRIVESVSPILPITLRDKSLDGGYLRTALYLLGAAEFLFAQYETDVRNGANPAGVVGMCNSMHAEIERSAHFNEQLKPLREFGKDLKTQYQTFLGLGSSFAKDSGTRGRRRSGRGRGRTQARGWESYRPSGFTNDTRTPLQGANFGTVAALGSVGRGMSTANSSRARDFCFDYRAGRCRRGGACRFLHNDQ